MRTLIVHGHLYTVSSEGASPLRGPQLGTYPILEDGVILIEDGIIHYVGDLAHVPNRPIDTTIDAQGQAVIPGFVDCHTHLPFAGWRVDEYRARLAGLSYEALSQQDGGIRYSSRQFHNASDDDLLAMTRSLLYESLAWGTTTLEMKTGYGLTVAQEWRALQLIQQLQAESLVRISATGLFLHAVPPNYTADQWAHEVLAQLWPQLMSSPSPLISAVDVFVERTTFTPAQVRPLLQAAQDAGFLIRLHTDQFSSIGGVEVGLAYKARGLDHLEALRAEEVEAVARSTSTAVLLPTAAFYANSQHQGPARAIIDAGGAVALATDFNPGTSPVNNLPTVIALAVNQLRLSPEEALAASTLNAAHVLGLDSQVGSLTAGKVADILILDSPDIASIAYRLGHNPIKTVIQNGTVVEAPLK